MSHPSITLPRVALTLVAVATLGAVSPAAAAAQTRMLRSPTVSADNIAFAYANNIWVVPRAGGIARRLTSFQGETQNPKFSPDGKLVAFSAEYGGNTDVYVVPVDGGQPRRLTWHPAPDVVQGWTPDGKAVVFASSRATDAPIGAPKFWTVPLTGGLPQPMPMPRAYQGKISPDGRMVAYRMNNSWDEERRNYRGGQNRPIWILDLKTLDVQTPPQNVDAVALAGGPKGEPHAQSAANPDSKDMDPVWLGDVVYFLSDRDGVSNVWSYDTQSKKLAQTTDFSDFDVKTLDAGAGVLVFEQAGYIHELDPRTGQQHVVNIDAAGDFPWMMPQWKDVSGRIVNMALSPTGKRALVEARGEIFTIPAAKGSVRDLTNTSGAAERDPAWSPDGRFVSYFSDRTGEYNLYIQDQDGLRPPREIALPNHKHYYTPEWSPDGKSILFTDADLNLWVVDVASGVARKVGNDPWMVPQRTMDPVWSPDSRWIAYVKHLNSLYHAIFVYDTRTGETHQFTDGLADAVSPAWDASGKYLSFLASTDFGLRSQWLDMTSYDHLENFALYVAVLKDGESSPLLPQSDEEVARGEGRVATSDSSADSSRIARRDSVRPSPLARRPSVTIDFPNLPNRILSIPGVAVRRYAKLEAGAPGTVFFLEQLPAVGTAEEPAMAPRFALHRYQLNDRKAADFVPVVADYAVSRDGHKLLYRAVGGGAPGAAMGGPAPAQLFIVDADKAPPAAGQGRIDARLRAFIDPRQEFRQIFDEGWRNQRDYLYVPNLHGTDWPRMKQMYGQLLPYVNHRSDLNYLLDMMGSEIAIGHSFVRGGDMPEVPRSTAGLLGADVAVENGRYRVTKVYDAESWNPDLYAPLAQPGSEVKTGEYILAIDGQELRGTDNIFRLLDGTASRQIDLTVNARPTLDGARHVTVVPVPNDQGLRTRAWVEHNRHVVDSLSHGQLAYVWLPNTAQGGYESFNRYYFAQQDRKGAVIDERFNTGGSAADYIIDVLQRDFDGYFNNVAGDREPFTSPEAGIWGPKVMIINEMAGSGGDLMPYMFKHRHLGELVGKRTWGGLVHTADTPPLIDGGIMIAPRGGFFDLNGKWAVENEGVAPDVDVENWPKEVDAGHDPQLERAVSDALKSLADHPVDRVMHEPPPPTWGKRIKPMKQ